MCDPARFGAAVVLHQCYRGSVKKRRYRRIHRRRSVFFPEPRCKAMEMEIRCKVISKFARIPLLAQFSGNLSSSNAVAGGTNNLPPLLFHQVHGENIRVSECGAVARRVESFCKGLTFSSRPVRIAEKVYVKIIGVSNNWSGVIRFGFTANDPSTLRNALPKYACPDMTNKPGCWAKALAERFAEVDSVLFYYVTQTGDVHFGINGEERGVFFTGVETRGPLWAVLDVYGNSTAIQLLDPRQQLNNSRRIQAPCSSSSGVSACQQGPSPSSSTSSSSSSSSSNIGMVDTVSDVDRIIPSIASLSLQQQQHLQVHLQQQQNLQRASQMAEGFSPSAVTPTTASGESVEQVPVQLSRFQPSGSHYSPLPFHRTRGRNVRLSNDRCVASRLDTEFSRGYVFTSRPIVLGEKIVVQVLATDAVYVGALAFGLTSCNPSQIPSGGADLPDDSDLLLDRPEYWVVSKDVAGGRPERGDEISVCVTHLGEVLISKNGSPPEVRMHVDHSLELWAFFDVYGTTQKIRIVGSFIEPQPPSTSSSPVPQTPAISGMSSCVASSSPATSWPNSRPTEQQTQAPNLSRLRVCLPNSSDHPAPPPYHPAPSVVLTPVASVSGTTSPSPAHPNHHPHHHSSHHHHSSSHQSSPASSASPTPGSGVLVVNLPPTQSNYLNQQQQSQSSQQSHGHGSQQSHQGSQQSGHHQNHRMPHMSSSSSLSVVAIPPSGSGTLLSTYSHTYIEPVSATTSYSTMESSGGRTGTMMSGAGGSGGAGSECSICYERPIDSVLYMCGHMCMCYECALQQWRGKGGGHCPLCRALIKDVIRTYKS